MNMKGIGKAVCCMALWVLGCVCADVQAEKKWKYEAEIKQCFMADLEGKEYSFTPKKTISKEEIALYQQKVWELWKEANRKFSEEKLIDLSKLSEQSTGVWHLPEELEPHAAMPYYYGLKGEEKPENGYPFFLYLHGSGPKEREWATGLALCSRFDDAPSAYFIPQIPNEEGYYRWWQKSKQYAWEKMLRQLMVCDVIDANRIYWFGISEGGYGSQRLASYYADYLAAAGPMAGGNP